jgi:hypothetical protein
MNRHERLTRDVLLFGLIPTWIAAGVLDWWCHRRTRIEENAGLPESLSHAAMLVQAGIPATLGLFLEVDPPLLALTYAATATHTATAYWDVAYAAPRRKVPPIEQHAHAFLEVLPMAGAAFLTVLHPRQAQDLFRGKGLRRRFRLKRHPLGPGYIAGLLGTLAVALGIPYTEELVRCTRAALRRRSERAASRTPAPPAPEIASSGPEHGLAVDAPERRPLGVEAGRTAS